MVTLERLAKALSTTPEELAADPNKDSVNEAAMRRWGYRKVNTYLHGDTALSLALVEQRYGISAKRQLDMAPLFTALLAEMSLRDRRQKLEDLSNAFEEYSANLPAHLSHGESARSDFDNAHYDEKESISSRDLFGRHIQKSAEEHGYTVSPFDPEVSNPFVNFLKEMAKTLELNIMDSQGDEPDILADGLPEAACAFHEQVQEICGDNYWARLALQHGYARNGPEFVAQAVQNWIEAVGAKTAYIVPGSPWENGYCESFNARFRDEFLNGEVFYNLREAEILIEQWRKHYNTKRPHSALGYRPPTPKTIVPIDLRPVMH